MLRVFHKAAKQQAHDSLGTVQENAAKTYRSALHVTAAAQALQHKGDTHISSHIMCCRMLLTSVEGTMGLNVDKARRTLRVTWPTNVSS